jgi:cytochrome P450 family 135
VYATDAGGGRAGAVRRQFLEPVVGQHSLLSLDDQPWRRHRRLLGGPLHGRAVAGYREEIARIAADEITTWPHGEPFPLRDRMQNITLEVILRLVFGIRDADRLARLRVLLAELIDVGGSVLLLITPARIQAWLQRSAVLGRLRFLATTRFGVAKAAVDEILFDEIARRRRQPRDDATDVLSRLLASRDEDDQPMSDEEIRDELITMLQAGHETTATGLAWAFERLLRTPDVHQRLRTALRDGDGGDYLDAVVKEALRSRPVVYNAPRLLDAPLTLGGHTVPAGWYAGPLISHIHHDPDVYPQPDQFRPERFLSPDTARAQQAWMPFGGGRRYCVGAQLALLEMKVIITEVLRRVDLTPPTRYRNHPVCDTSRWYRPTEPASSPTPRRASHRGGPTTPHEPQPSRQLLDAVERTHQAAHRSDRGSGGRSSDRRALGPVEKACQRGAFDLDAFRQSGRRMHDQPRVDLPQRRRAAPVCARVAVGEQHSSGRDECA